MGKLTVVEVYSYTEWVAASYTDERGEEYEITFTRNYDSNNGYETKEVVNIEKAGIAIDEGPIWKEVRQAVNAG